MKIAMCIYMKKFHIYNRSRSIYAKTQKTICFFACIILVQTFAHAALNGVPTMMPNYGEDVEVFWARHPFNPESPNYDPVINYPTPIINIADYGNNIQTAINALPSGGGTVILNNGGYYSGWPDITARTNLYFACTNGTAEIVPGGYIAGCSEAKSYHNHADCANAFNQTCLDCLTELATRNIVFENLELITGGDGWRIVAAKDILFLNCTFKGDCTSCTDQYANYRTHFVARQWAENIWAIGCTFTGYRKYHLYCDGVHSLGIVDCFFDDTTDSGAGIFFANDDFSVDVNQNGRVEPKEARQIKYHIFYGNTFEAANSWTHCILLQGQHNLVKNNTVIGTPRSFVEFKSRFSYLHPYHVYEAIGNKVISNTTEGCSVEWIQMNHLNFEEGGNRDVQCPYAVDGVMGKYTVKCNKINGSVPVFINEAGAPQIGPNIVTNNCINDPGCVPCDGAPPTDLTPPSVPDGLVINQESDTYIAMSWNASTDNVAVTEYRILRDGIRCGFSSDTNFIDYPLSPAQSYAYSVQAKDAAGNLTEPSTSVSGTTDSISGSAVPSPWQTAKIGNGETGNAAYENGLFSIQGGGSDIGATGDSFYYVYQVVTGDFSFVARLVNQERIDPYVKAGLMLRQELTSASAKEMILMTPAFGGRCRVRDYSGSNSVKIAEYPSLTPPCWFKMTRTGNEMALYASTDGSTWTLEATNTLAAMPATANVGLAVCAHGLYDLALCQFDNVDLALSGAVAMPTLSPTDGYTRGAITVSVSCATSGAEIRYTTNGSEPTESSTLYSSPIVLTNNAEIKARGFKTDMTPSGIARGEYLFYATVEPPEEHGIWIEAEWGVMSEPYVVRSGDTNASGTEYIGFMENNNLGGMAAGTAGAGKATYGFTITNAGSHRIWCRVIGPSDQDDSFWLKVDNEAHFLWDITETSEWTWEQQKTVTLSEGDHTIEISEREDGVKIDCMLIAWNAGLSPTGGTPTAWSSGDFDGDSIPDSWELASFTNTDTASGSTDSDGDGASDLHEYLAGTQPTNNTSLLRIENLRSSVLDGESVVSWQTVPGRSYILQRTTNFMSSFSNITSGMMASNSMLTTTVTVENIREYYRIRLNQ